MPYGIIGFEQVQAWIEAHPDDEQVLSAWLQAALWDPNAVTHATVTQIRTRRTIHVAQVPDAGVMVNFLVFETPVRLISILKIIPAPDS